MSSFKELDEILMDLDPTYVSVSERQDGKIVWRTGTSGEWIAYKPVSITEVRP